MNEPKLYSKHNSLQTTDNIHVIENFLGLIDWTKGDNQTAIDLGCGEGYTTANILLPKLPPSLTRLVGCDISEKMIRFAKKARRNSRLDFRQLDLMDGETCRRISGQFDHVFSFYCLHWIADQRKAFDNIRQLLKPGGDLLMSFLGTNPIYDVYESMSRNIQWASYFRKEMVSPYHNCKNAKQKVTKLLQEAGFQDLRCVVEDRQHVFTSLKHMEKSIIAVDPILPKLSPEERVQYIKDFTKEVRNIYSCNVKWFESGSTESTPVDYKLIIVYARKPSTSTTY
ncbi:hypothetical protein HUJ04_011533 [Dendroctonus ponderosae]|uniref:Methyltransferase type 12 domain-containing protein n=2 Tax=Dendroctonus ponderosae TaxID=77166 RepID=A0AAR5PHC3_DENPD|nr:hypothetical protein HUJ04_011533 [Dendroctonus ponderosae]